MQDLKWQCNVAKNIIQDKQVYFTFVCNFKPTCTWLLVKVIVHLTT